MDLESECKKAKAIVIKTIRAPMILFNEILRDLPETKIIHLIRDPRPTTMSQGTYITTKASRPNYAGTVCGRILADMSVADMFSVLIPTSNIVRVKYENIALNPVEMTHVLYNFANISLSDAIIKQIMQITSSGISKSSGPLSIQKANSSAVVDEWRSKASLRFVQSVDDECRTFYSRIGYLPVENNTVLNDTSFRLFFNFPSSRKEKFSCLENYPIGTMVKELGV